MQIGIVTISLELAKNAARQRTCLAQSRTCLAQRNLSFRPKAMLLKVGGVDYRYRCAFPTCELLANFASAADSWSQHVKRLVALRATHLLIAASADKIGSSDAMTRAIKYPAILITQRSLRLKLHARTDTMEKHKPFIQSHTRRHAHGGGISRHSTRMTTAEQAATRRA